ncbi:MAG: hypothetical protein JWR58_702 [Pseudonocardia sp.]|nr:hypothetical protein [Pseudonocardia sp.]
MGVGERRGSLPHRLGEQQLAAPRGDQLLDGSDGALVGDGEVPQLAHLVAPELDADGVLSRRGEHVDDPAAHRELAPGGDHLDARVGQLDEPDEQRVEVGDVAHPQLDGVEPTQPRRDRLDEAARGGDHHTRRGLRVRQPPEDLEPASHGVGAGRKPLVRERLPRGQDGDCGAAEQVARRGAEVLGLPVGGGDGKHGVTCAARVGGGAERRREERTQRRGSLDPQSGHLVRTGVAGGLDDDPQVGIGQAGAEQTGELGHGVGDPSQSMGSARRTDPYPGGSPGGAAPPTLRSPRCGPDLAPTSPR